MGIQEQIKLTEELLEGVKELNGEYQEGWENVIENAEKLINQLKQGSKLPMHDVSQRYTIEDIERCVENWGLCKVEKEYIERFLNGG